jgi:ComF family protein
MAFSLLDLVFPPRCTHCHAYLRRGGALCAACQRRIVLHKTFFCGRCRARRYTARGLCHRGFPYCLAAAGQYEDPALRSLVRALKFQFVRAAAEPLGAMLAAYVRRLRLADEGYGPVLPIPLGRKRQRQRGFNQTELIARALARRTGLRLAAGALARVKDTLPQSGLGSGLDGQKRRRANIAGCFRVVRADAVAGRKVILLDDVATTGATLLEATLALKRAGAKEVLALTAAKT